MNLTTTEFSAQKDKLLLKFATAQVNSMNQKIWRTYPKGRVSAKVLWLFVYALNSYTHSDTADNNLTEKQVQLIFAKANTLKT